MGTALPAPHSVTHPVSPPLTGWPLCVSQAVPPGQRGCSMCRQHFAADLGALPSSTCTAAPSEAGEKEADPFKGWLFAPPAAKQSFLSIINCSSRVLAELHQQHSRGRDLQEQSPGFWRSCCSPPPRPRHEKPARRCGRQQSHSNQPQAVSQKQSFNPTLICSILG